MHVIKLARQSKFEYGGITIRRMAIPLQEECQDRANLALVDVIAMRQQESIPATNTKNDIIVHYVLQGSVKLSVDDQSFLLNSNTPHLHYSTQKTTLHLTTPFIDSEVFRICFYPQGNQQTESHLVKTLPPHQLDDSIKLIKVDLGFSSIYDITNEGIAETALHLPPLPFTAIYLRVIKGHCTIDKQLLQSGDVIYGDKQLLVGVQIPASTRLIVIYSPHSSTLITSGLLASE